MRWVLTLLCVWMLTLSASAQSVLESLERELTSLTRKVQSGVVSVEGGALVAPDTAPSVRAIAPPSETARRWLEAMRLLNLPSPVSRKGSGFIIDREGWVLTSADIVRGAETCTVRFADGRRTTARVVSIDDVTNLALLKCSEPTPQSLSLGDSDRVEVGSLLLCVGTLGGYERSAVLVMVSGRERSGAIGQQQFLSNLLQVSGAVGAGGSGAPLVNARGEVVGVIVASIAPGMVFLPPDSASARRTAPPSLGTSLEMSLFGATGGALAVPINDVKSVLDDMRAGRLRRAFLGVMPADRDGGEGAEVVRVVPNSPAARAGFRLGDVIVGINNTPVRRAGDVSATLRRLKPGDTVQIDLLRGATRIRVRVQLGERGSLSP